jgi:hypothetical protein
MDSKKTLKAKSKQATEAKKPAAIAKAAEAQATPAPAKTAAKNFLFSIPSLHTHENDYEHLVVAPTKEDACRLLAEHRVTEKAPQLQGEPRSQLVTAAMGGYSGRDVAQIEPRKEPAGVLAVNHHKLGVASPSLH